MAHPETSLPLPQHTMVCGADVTHPPTSDSSSPSIAAVVASVDPLVTKYRGRVALQPACHEMIKQFRTVDAQGQGVGMILDLLKTYCEANGQRPQSIIFYRDGVSESQFDTVLDEEVKRIFQACEDLEPGYAPKLTFIVVQKRHHMRFLPNRQSPPTQKASSHKQQHNNQNIKHGTVVDETVCHPFLFDFYLQSHSCEKGTSRSTHYHVLLDQNNFSSDDLQRLTHSLCYNYARCTRAISMVAPTYYAHLLASKARCHLGLDNNTAPGAASGEAARYFQSVTKDIDNKMYFS